MASADRFLLATMTSPQVSAEVAAGRTTIVVPFGAVEQHGPHLPLHTDTVLADRLAPLIAERLDGLCAPTIPIGRSKHHLAFAGTLSFQPETLHMVVRDLVESLAAHEFRRIILLPTHGGNEGPLRQAATESRRDGITIVVLGLGAIVAALLADASARGVTPGDQGGHAGELETSLMLALAPDLVRTSSMKTGYMGPLDEAASHVFFDQGAAALSPNGVIGDRPSSTRAAGHIYVSAFLKAVEEQLRKIDDHDKA